MNICLISQEYPPETNWGGIATYTQTLARELFRRGERVHVITLGPEKQYTMDDKGVTVHRIALKPKGPLKGLKKWIMNISLKDHHPILDFSQSVYEEIVSIHKNEPVDIIEAPDTCAQGLITFRLLNGVKKITRLHTPFFQVRQLNQMGDNPEALKRDFMEKKQTELSTMVTSPTYALAGIVRDQWGIKDIKVIPNFFNLSHYTQDLSAYRRYFRDEDEYILFFGRLEVRKGVHIFAEALAEVFQRDNDIKAVFVGKESIYNNMSMKEYIKEILGEFSSRAIFIEHLPHDALYPIIERSKFVVLPSLWENFPYACLEAMNFGKVVIGTTGSGFGEIIEEGVSGILVDPVSPKALEKAVLNSLQSKNLEEMGQRAKKRAAEFSSDKVVPRILEFYNQIVRKVA